MKKSEKNISDLFTTEILSEKEMHLILGGKRRNPKSREKDHYDFDEDED